MRVNDAVIPHYRCDGIPIDELKKQIYINDTYLKEKPTWYNVEDRLHYFKIRKDFRVFTEIFFSKFAKDIMELQSVQYTPAYIREKNTKGNSKEETTRFGLLSENFQSSSHNHYLVSELMQAEISDFILYSGYNMKSLLDFFRDYLCQEDYKKNELFLIKLFISDGFTCQVDRNPNNIAFQIPRIDGVDYKERLRIEKLKKMGHIENALQFCEEKQDYLLKGFEPNIVYDSERIFGVDHRNMKKYNPEDCWVPLFPYSKELDFTTLLPEEVKELSKKEYDGLDPNLCALYFDYPDICKPYFERLAYDDEYRKILEECEDSNKAISITEDEKEYITNIVDNQREVFRKILTY